MLLTTYIDTPGPRSPAVQRATGRTIRESNSALTIREAPAARSLGPGTQTAHAHRSLAARAPIRRAPPHHPSLGSTHTARAQVSLRPATETTSTESVGRPVLARLERV